MTLVNGDLTAVVLAGGRGTRLKSVVSDVPKPMAQVNGAPFLEHLLLYWRAQGVRRFIVSVCYQYEKIVKYFGHTFESCAIEYVIESAPLGTGGALLKCVNEAQLSTAFLLFNGDTYLEVDLGALRDKAVLSRADWVLSLISKTDFERYTPYKLKRGGVLEPVRRFPTQNIARGMGVWANGGVYWVNPHALSPFYAGDFLNLEAELLVRCFEIGQKIVGVPTTGQFIDIGTPADFAIAQSMDAFRQRSSLGNPPISGGAEK